MTAAYTHIRRIEPLLKPAVFLLSLVPFLWCLYQILLLQGQHPNALGADPGKAIVLFNGEWALRFLILTLAITPLRIYLSWPFVARLRRMLGLYAFFYASLHLSSYAVFLLELRFGDIVQDIVKRPYITVGFSAFLLMAPLALTSTTSMMKRLKSRWKSLHRLVYVIAVLAVIHLVWLTKSDYQEAVVYGSILSLLLAVRVYRRYVRRSGMTASRTSRAPEMRA